MSYLIGKFLDKFREINTATLTGAIDVIIVEQPDGTFSCSPFHVRFGKMGVLRSKEKIVEIEINGNPVNIHMKLGDSGEAFFVQPVDLDEDGIIPPHLTCSPIPMDDHPMESVRALNQPHLFEPKAKKSIEFLRNPPIHEIESVGSSGKSDENIYVFDKAQPSMSSENIEEREEEVAVITEKCESEKEVKKDEEDESEAKNESSETDNEDVRKSESSIALPKTFSAETITENVEFVRKISAVTNEFRPIELETGEDTKTEDKPLTHSNSKRRRKKRGSAKKKASVVKRPASLELKQEDIAAPESKEPPEDPELANVKYSAMETDIHFFSDTEVTSGPSDSHRPRPPSVELASVLSDSEVEMKRTTTTKPHQQSWNWGELPSPPPLNYRSAEADSNQQEAAVKRSLLASLMGFMKRTKHMRNSPQSEGIYLSDLNVDDLEPHIAQLYFGNNYKQLEAAVQNDASGQRGGSVSSGESGRGPSISGSPNSEPGSPAGPVLPMGEVALSLCGKLGTPDGPSAEEFAQHTLPYETLATDPNILDNPDLVVRIEGKYYSWKAASPIILSWVAYQKPLPKEVVEKMTPQETPELPERKRTRSYSSWFSWKRGGAETSPEKNLDASENKKDISSSSMQDDSLLATMAEILNQIPEITDQAVSSDSDEDLIRNRRRHSNANHKKTLRLTSEQIAGLNLRSGMNEVEFSVTTAYQGTTRCKCYLFLWRWNDKIVISDIDGTITKSDVLGHVLPIMGKDWAQNGVARLFTKIKENGYKLLYLSARAIGQSRVTREYLQSVKQEDLTLPEGPMLLNPTSLLNAFHTEVIEKKPQEFKISCLRDIMALFPANTQPFYAGYGNKVNDVWSYQAVGIPLSRIFTINSRGEVKHEMTQTFQSTYSNMSYLVDQMFPSSLQGTSSEDFSQFVYWREPIPETLSDEAI